VHHWRDANGHEVDKAANTLLRFAAKFDQPEVPAWPPTWSPASRGGGKARVKSVGHR
jgi:hypothetical protein